MIFTIYGKKYNFGEKYTRMLDHGHEIFVCNAPESVSDEMAVRIINGSGVPDWGYMSVPKDNLWKYEVKE